ncbi:MAG: hypothetical protein Q4A13_07920, partial [Fretibacterium sp.]|nr:hypothetical protein [Fretibacterium sp.]
MEGLQGFSGKLSDPIEPIAQGVSVDMELVGSALMMKKVLDVGQDRLSQVLVVGGQFDLGKPIGYETPLPIQWKAGEEILETQVLDIINPGTTEERLPKMYRLPCAAVGKGEFGHPFEEKSDPDHRRQFLFRQLFKDEKGVVVDSLVDLLLVVSDLRGDGAENGVFVAFQGDGNVVGMIEYAPYIHQNAIFQRLDEALGLSAAFPGVFAPLFTGESFEVMDVEYDGNVKKVRSKAETAGSCLEHAEIADAGDVIDEVGD